MESKSNEEKPSWVIRIKDTIRKDASDALRYLDSVILSSGDNETEVSRVASELSITDARSNQSPEDKLELIKSLPTLLWW